MSFPLHRSACTRQQRYRRRQQAAGQGNLQRVRRIHALLALAENPRVSAGAALLNLGQQPVRDYRHALLQQGAARLSDNRPPGRPSKRTTPPRRPLADLLTAGRQAAGYTSGCWHTPRLPDLLPSRCGVAYHPHSLATVLPPRGFSSPKARLVSAHRQAATRLEWRRTTWPESLRDAHQRNARLLFGAAASCAQWGSRRSPWAPKGQQPEGQTSGTRQGDKGLGLLDACSGQFFSTAHAGRWPAESSAAFRLDGLAHTPRHVVGSPAGARSQTSQAMHEGFQAHAARLPIEPLPSSSPDCTPMAPLWKQGKKAATHVKYFPDFSPLQAEVDRALRHFAHTPREITVLMVRYGETLGAKAA